MNRVLGVILAGGQARRMGGGDKGLLPLGQSTILGHVIDRLDPQVAGMALNANGDTARFASHGLPVISDSIEGFAGPLAGVLAGLDWAAEQGLGAVATAHQMDDAAETLLMRLARGSGLAGLAGVRAFTHVPGREDVALIRPLLGFRKAELEAVVEVCGISPVRDASNEDTNFDRVRVRQQLVENEWLDAEALAASAQHLSEGWRALEWYAELDWEEMVAREDTEEGAPQYRYFCNVPRAIQVETVCRIVSELGGRVTRSEAGVAANRLWRGENASLGGVLARASVEKVAKVGVKMRVWRFSPEPPRRTH